MKFTGIYRGVVVDAQDPEARGRVKVQVMAIAGTSAVWAERCAPSPGAATKATGSVIGATAWVMFEAGDPNNPVVVGFKP